MNNGESTKRFTGICIGKLLVFEHPFFFGIVIVIVEQLEPNNAEI